MQTREQQQEFTRVSVLVDVRTTNEDEAWQAVQAWMRDFGLRDQDEVAGEPHGVFYIQMFDTEAITVPTP